MTDELYYDEEDDKDKGDEQDNGPMAGAFDFDVPEGDPDDISDLSDEDDSAQGTGDEDDSAGDEDDSDDKKPAEKDEIDPKLLVRVGRMDLSDEDTDRVLGLGTSEAITNMLDLLESQKKESGGESVKEQAEWFELSDDAVEDFAPELVEVLKNMNGTTKKAVELLLGQYDKRFKDMSQSMAEQGMDAFDDAVESLGKDWTSIFGKEGKIESGHERNLERLRKAVFSDEYKGSVARRVKTAVSDMFGEHTKKLAKNANVKKARNRQGKFIGRPAQRSMSNADMSPRQRAVANVSKSMKEKGMHPEQLESIDYSENL